MSKPSPRSRPSRSRRCPRSRACGSPPRRPASATRAAPTCSRDAGRGHRRSPASSPARNGRRPRWTGAARSCRAAEARALVVNSGNANAFTGKTGASAATLTAEIAAKALGCSAARGLHRLHRRHRRAARRRPSSTACWPTARGRAAPDALDSTRAKAIMTTDTFPKVRDARRPRSTARR